MHQELWETRSVIYFAIRMKYIQLNDIKIIVFVFFVKGKLYSKLFRSLRIYP